MKMMNMQAIGSNINSISSGVNASTANFSRQFPLPMQHLLKALERKLPILIGSLWLCSCTAHSAPEVRNLTLQQQWSLNPGDEIAGNLVSGSLGDISIALKNGRINAPFDGELEPSAVEKCALYSTPEIPAYLFRLCGLNSIAYGEIQAGKRIGKGDFLSFATMRRQPDGTWIIVEPARGVLEKALEQ